MHVVQLIPKLLQNLLFKLCSSNICCNFQKNFSNFQVNIESKHNQKKIEMVNQATKLMFLKCFLIMNMV